MLSRTWSKRDEPGQVRRDSSSCRSAHSKAIGSGMSRGGELVNVPQTSPKMEPILIETGRGVTGFCTRSWHSSAGEVTRSSRQAARSEEHTSEPQSRPHLVCRLLLE